MSRKNTTAFSLIELMVVIAIIGILSSIAIPSYRNYTIKAKITEGFQILNSLKNMSSEYYTINGSFPNTSDIGKLTTDFATDIIAWAKVEPNGYHGAADPFIEVGFHPSVFNITELTDPRLAFIATTVDAQVIIWQCYTNKPSQTTRSIPSKYLPASCQVHPEDAL